MENLSTQFNDTNQICGGNSVNSGVDSPNSSSALQQPHFADINDNNHSLENHRITKVQADSEIDELKFPVTDEDKKTAAEQFMVGDIILTKAENLKKIHRVDLFTTFVQKIISKLSRNKIGSNITHTAIVVEVDKENGKVWIAEAWPSKDNPIRRIDLFAHRGARLDENDAYSYQVLRGENEHNNMALTAAKIGEAISVRPGYVREEGEAAVKKGKFSYRLALKAVISKKQRNLSTKSEYKISKGILKKIIDHRLSKVDETHIAGGKKGKLKKYFCSFLTSDLLQRAKIKNMELDEVLNKEINEVINYLEKETDSKAKSKFLSAFAESRGIAHNETIKNAMGVMFFNPKKTGPQKLTQFCRENGFKPVLNVVPPSSTPENP